MRVGVKELRNRWTTPAGRQLSRDAWAWLTGDAASPPAGLERIDGRLDLRGFDPSTSVATVGSQDDPRRGVTWQGLDLRHASLVSLRFFGCHVRDCLFDSAGCHDWRVWGTRFEDCSFTRADLRSRALGGGGPWNGLRTGWTRTTFDRARLVGATFRGCDVIESSFADATGPLFLTDCVIRACTFRGTIRKLVIDGRGHFHDPDRATFSADLSRARLDEILITGYPLERTALPDQPDLRVLRRYTEVLGRAHAALQGDAGVPARRAAAMIEPWLAAPGPPEADLCFDLDGIGRDDVAAALDGALRAAGGA